MINLVVGLKSINLEDQDTALNFIQAVCQNFKLKSNIIFLYQNAVNLLLDDNDYGDQLKNNKLKLINLSNKYNLTINVCKSACKKRGISIDLPFVPATIVQFLNYCNFADRVIQF